MVRMRWFPLTLHFLVRCSLDIWLLALYVYLRLLLYLLYGIEVHLFSQHLLLVSALHCFRSIQMLHLLLHRQLIPLFFNGVFFRWIDDVVCSKFFCEFSSYFHWFGYYYFACSRDFSALKCE